MHKYLHIGVYKTIIPKKRKSSSTNSHVNSFFDTNTAKLHLQYCNSGRNSIPVLPGFIADMQVQFWMYTL